MIGTTLVNKHLVSTVAQESVFGEKKTVVLMSNGVKVTTSVNFKQVVELLQGV